MLWAEHVARNTAGERDDVFAEVRKHFDEAELVELTGVCGLFAQSNRFQDSLRLTVEAQHDIDKIRQSVKIDPDRLKAYVEGLIETWPNRFPAPPDIRPQRKPRWESPAAPLHTKTRPHSRVRLIDPQTATGDAAWLLDSAHQLLEGTPNFVRLWSHATHLGKLILPLHVALSYQGAGSMLAGRLKAVATVRTSHVNAASYSLAHREALGRASGLTQEQLGALGSAEGATSSCFTRRERAAIVWAEHVALNTAKYHDDVFNELEAHFDNSEVVELTALCAFSNNMDRIQNALRLPLEAQPDIDTMYRSDHIEPSSLRKYLQAVVESWPRQIPVPRASDQE
ncbi:MAG: carboxymuconolactone decarboxylase family protein [Gammaproteobacteria bacterium]